MATKLGSVWMPCKLKHDMKESLRYLRGLASGKGESFRPYVHEKGKLIATMTRAAAEDLRLAIASSWREASKDVLLVVPADVAHCAADSLRMVQSITSMRAARALDSLTLPRPLANVLPIRAPAPLQEDRTQIACMGCFWPELPHGCGKGQAAAQ